MKNIIFIISDITSGGGMQRVTINIANYLSNLNKYNVKIISLAKGDGKIKYYVDDKVKVECLSIEKFKLRRDFFKAGKKLKEIVPKNFEGTVIVDDVGYTITTYLALNKHKNIKLVCWTHMHYYHGRSFGFAGVGRRLAMCKFDKIILLTKEDYDNYAKLDKRDIRVQIYNPIDKDIENSNYSSVSKKIISCGRLNRIKGFDYLIEAAKIVLKKHPDWTWDIYGEGPEFNNLNMKIKEYKLENNLFLKGYSKDILSLYKEYSMYVFTSRDEGCPMAMIEAQASGLPMISFDFRCGPKDLISDGVNGFIIKDYDINEIANKINYMIENKDKRVSFSNNSKVNLKELELDYVLNKWQDLLDNL